MSQVLPTGMRGRLTALAILVMPLLLAWRFVLEPAWMSYTGILSDGAEYAAQAERYQAIGQALPALEQQAARLRADQPLAPYLLEGDSQALAAANLQRKLQQDARKHQGRILSARVAKATEDGPFERVAIDVRVQLPLEGLQALLYELETGQPQLYLDGLTITARPPNRRTGEPPEMDVRMVLFGLRQAAPGDDGA